MTKCMTRKQFRKYKRMRNTVYVLAGVGIAALCFLIYVALAYVYAQNRTHPAPQRTRVSELASGPDVYRPDDFLFIHRVNTPDRVQRKRLKYNNFELDVITEKGDETVYIAHDDSQLKGRVTFKDIMNAQPFPQYANYWVDMKHELTQKQINQVLADAKAFGLNPERLIFEPATDENARLLRKNGLNIILQITGFKKGLTPEQEAALVKDTERRIRELEPIAISSGMGQYPFLRTYFPDYYKAICYNTTKRPSIKKEIVKRLMKSDPTVTMFLVDEYDWDN